jgi:hypothetical protein
MLRTIIALSPAGQHQRPRTMRLQVREWHCAALVPQHAGPPPSVRAADLPLGAAVHPAAAAADHPANRDHSLPQGAGVPAAPRPA